MILTAMPDQEVYRRAYAGQPADDTAEWAANASRHALADMEPYIP